MGDVFEQYLLCCTCLYG